MLVSNHEVATFCSCLDGGANSLGVSSSSSSISFCNHTADAFASVLIWKCTDLLSCMQKQAKMLPFLQKGMAPSNSQKI